MLGAASLQASPVSKTVAGLPSWSVQVDSAGAAVTVVGWIRPGGKNYWGRKGAVLTQPLRFSNQQCSVESLTGK